MGEAIAMMMQVKPSSDRVSEIQNLLGLFCLISSDLCCLETNADQTLALFFRMIITTHRMSGMIIRQVNQAG